MNPDKEGKHLSKVIQWQWCKSTFLKLISTDNIIKGDDIHIGSYYLFRGERIESQRLIWKWRGFVNKEYTQSLVWLMALISWEFEVRLNSEKGTRLSNA